MKRMLLMLALAATVVGCSKKEQPKQETYVYEPVRITSAYVALAENPEAARVLLMGDEAKRLAPVFEHAGVKASATLGGKFDTIVIACGEMTPESCAKAASHLTDGGVMAWLMDVSEMTAAQFRSRIKSFALESVHLWMPGETRWMLVGRKTKKSVKLAAMLDLFAREGTFADLAKSRCGALPELFASYAGSREDVMPAFAVLKLSDFIGPQNFLTRDVNPLDWISEEGIDADIAKSVRAEMRSMQVVRRLVVEGNLQAMAATDKKTEEKTAETWAKAALRNPNDLFLLERMDRLDRNARGFLEVGKVLPAMKCYETMVLVRPNDAAAIHNFGMCLKKIGKLDLANQVLDRARQLTENSTSTNNTTNSKQRP